MAAGSETSSLGGGSCTHDVVLRLCLQGEKAPIAKLLRCVRSRRGWCRFASGGLSPPDFSLAN